MMRYPPVTVNETQARCGVARSVHHTTNIREPPPIQYA
jgi:hypothetical protein